MIGFIWNDEKKVPFSIGAGELLSHFFFIKFKKATTNSRKVFLKSSKETYTLCGHWKQTGNQIVCYQNSSYQAVYERDSDLHELISHSSCLYIYPLMLDFFPHSICLKFVCFFFTFISTYVQIQMTKFSLKRLFLKLKRAFFCFDSA